VPDHTPATKGVLGAGAFGKVFKAGFGINGTWGPGVGITDMQNELKKKTNVERFQLRFGSTSFNSFNPHVDDFGCVSMKQTWMDLLLVTCFKPNKHDCFLKHISK
jgi:hypothetical protein